VQGNKIFTSRVKKKVKNAIYILISWVNYNLRILHKKIYIIIIITSVFTDNIFTVKQKNNNKTQILFHNNFNGQKNYLGIKKF